MVFDWNPYYAQTREWEYQMTSLQPRGRQSWHRGRCYRLTCHALPAFLHVIIRNGNAERPDGSVVTNYLVISLSLHYPDGSVVTCYLVISLFFTSPWNSSISRKGCTLQGIYGVFLSSVLRYNCVHMPLLKHVNNVELFGEMIPKFLAHTFCLS